MRVLLVSTYELGHQPLHVASPAAALQAAGHEVRCIDTSVQQWDPALVDWAQALAFSVPMHTAMRLAIRGAEAARGQRPEIPVCFFGLYAPVNRDATVGRVADRVIAGEYEPGLVAWVASLDDGQRPAPDPEPIVHLGRESFRRPARELLPPLEHYAKLELGDELRQVGYVEASHGCVHLCRHCPVPVVYEGRIRIVGADIVLDDIDRLVDAGAQHITFGDPDFLNGVKHSLKIVEAMHQRHPELTFDCTTKIEHVLEHREVLPTLAEAGCLFAICAVESVNDEILERLDKGHTAMQATEAVALLREHGIEMRPSLLPFTPWTTVADVLDICDWVADLDLIPNVDPVHFTIRLLLPEGSLLLDHPDMQPYLGAYDREKLGYAWTPAHSETDALQATLAALVERAADEGEPIPRTFARVRTAVREAAGLAPLDEDAEDVDCCSAPVRPRLTEAWFCCAEPTEGQFAPLGSSTG